jgi:hypothetical protein
MRHPYKMRQVVGWYARPNRVNPRLMHAMDVLECGHVRHMPVIDSTVDALRAAMETMSESIGKRRCYECGKR